MEIHMHHVIDLPPSEVAEFEAARRKRQLDRLAELNKMVLLAITNFGTLAISSNGKRSRAFINGQNRCFSLLYELHSLRRKLHGP